MLHKLLITNETYSFENVQLPICLKSVRIFAVIPEATFQILAMETCYLSAFFDLVFINLFRKKALPKKLHLIHLV